MSEKFIHLDFGCGEKKKPGCLGMDIRPGKNVDVVISDDGNIPLKDNSVFYIYCNHVLEHVDDLGSVMSEFHRICCDGATIDIYVPHFTVPPFEYHRRLCRYDFLKCHCIKPTKNKKIIYPYYFECLERCLIFNRSKLLSRLFNRFPVKYEYTFLKDLFMCDQVYVKLRVVKEKNL